MYVCHDYRALYPYTGPYNYAHSLPVYTDAIIIMMCVCILLQYGVIALLVILPTLAAGIFGLQQWYYVVSTSFDHYFVYHCQLCFSFNSLVMQAKNMKQYSIQVLCLKAQKSSGTGLETMYVLVFVQSLSHYCLSASWALELENLQSLASLLSIIHANLPVEGSLIFWSK